MRIKTLKINARYRVLSVADPLNYLYNTMRKLSTI